jgi:hypothetical protein
MAQSKCNAKCIDRITAISPLLVALAAFVFGALSAPTAAQAEARRAFLVGIQRYNDGNIRQLTRTVNDANDLARDLEEVGFERKNVKVANDIRTKEAFDKEFNAFLKTVEPGDTVLFFFSGHGFGVEADQTNYLLLGDLNSPFAYTRSQLSESERKDAAVVRLRAAAAAQLEAYQKSEIPRAGVSATEIESRLAERKPKTVIMILDACRALVRAEEGDASETVRQKRGENSGSRLVTAHKPAPGFLVLYSASFGEEAVETFGTGRNSLFTEVLRSELQRPGQSLIELGERVKRMVRAIAQDKGYQQEPEFVYDENNALKVD